MADVHCGKCGEPYEYYYVRLEMSAEEREKFLNRQGCPCCNWGQSCTACAGTGYETPQKGILARYADPQCPHCQDQYYIYLRRRVWDDGTEEPAHGFWGYGYGKNYQIVSIDDKQVMGEINSEYVPPDDRFGGCTLQDVKVRCWHPHPEMTPCPKCQGTGTLQVAENAEQLALWSLFEATDLDPIEYL